MYHFDPLSRYRIHPPDSGRHVSERPSIDPFAAITYRLVHDGLGGTYHAALTPNVALLKPVVAPSLIHRAAAQQALQVHLPNKRLLMFPVGACWSRHGAWRAMPVGVEDVCRGSSAYEAQLRARLERRLGALSIDKTTTLPQGAASFFRDWLRRHPLPPMQGQLAWAALALPRERMCIALRDGTGLHGFAVAARGCDPYIEGFELEVLAHNRSVSPILGAWLVQRLAVELAQPLALGLSPLMGPVPVWLRGAKQLGEPLYPFASLATFKARQASARERRLRFLLFPAGAGQGSGTRAIRDLLNVFSGGSFRRFATSSLIHRLAPPLDPARTPRHAALSESHSFPRTRKKSTG